MSEPVRVQRKRVVGWRKPKNAIYVGRGSRWGNPFIVGKDCAVGDERPGFSATAKFRPTTRAVAVDLYRAFMTEGIETPLAVFQTPIPREEIRKQLAGKDLMCWCPLDQPCHADVLLELANGGRDE